MPCHMVAFQSGPCSNFAFCWPHSCSAICMQAKPRPQHCNQSVSLTTGKSHLRHLKLEVPCCQFPMVRLPQHQFFMLLGPCPALVLQVRSHSGSACQPDPTVASQSCSACCAGCQGTAAFPLGPQQLCLSGPTLDIEFASKTPTLILHAGHLTVVFQVTAVSRATRCPLPG